MDKPKIHPLIAIIIGVISVSTSAILVKLVTADSGVIAFYRMFFSVLLMTPTFLIYYRKEVLNIEKKDWIFSIIAGVFLAFHFILWFESLRYTSVASSTVLVTLQPLFAIIGTFIFFKEPIAFKTVFSGIIAIAGSILISWGDFKIGGLAFYGDMLALIACALVTGYMLFGQEVRSRVSLTTYTIIVYTSSTVTLFFYILFKGESFGPYPTMDWVWFLLLAIVPNLLGHNLFNWSLKWVSANVISIAILFEPVGASILAYFIFNENLVLTQVVGGIIVIAGITLFVIDESKIKKLFQKNY
ncbi:DMT family transporter [Rummeliibacillus pycnus]|uniref:DMT family transporter n=1 Tax=Rummeliibacillus pycnus TaxID=101070 RepID=UPI000C9B2326|nr:DMT family transporter [Rummeliibacillus pycnus]